MHRLFETLRPFIRTIVRRAGWVVAVAAVLSVAGMYFASKLTVDTDFSKLIPADYPSVQALERLREEVGGESSVDVVIESPSFEANKAFAEDFIPRALNLTGAGRGEPYLTRVDFRQDTEFMENNALYFATHDELDSLEAHLEEEMEQARLEANPFFFDIEDDFEDEDAAEDDQQGLASLNDSYRTIVGQEYPISDDSTTMVLRFYPSGSQTNLQFISDLYADLDQLAASMEPSGYHPEMEVDFGGRLLRQLVEVRAITDDVFSSFGAGVLSVLLVVVFYFTYKAYRARVGRRFDGRVLLSKFAHSPVMALIIGIPLLMSLTWTFGVASLAFGSLNLMTSTLGLVLFGLGIDYGIHFYARYSEERARGLSLSDAIETTFASTGQAIAVGALSTAAALYVLVFADFKGFSEFGFTAGTGVIFALLAMTLVMPALLVVFERLRLLNLEASLDVGGAQLDRRGRFPAARGLLLVSLGLVVAAMVFLPRAKFEYDFGALEPQYEAYRSVDEKIHRVYSGGRRNPAYILVDTPEEADQVKSVLLDRAQRDTVTTIGAVETIQDRFPLTEEEQQRKLERVAELRAMLQDPALDAEESEDVERLRQAAQTTEPISLEEVPEALKNRFLSKSGEIGHFVMVYPSVGLSDGRNSIAFANEVGTVVTEDGQEYHAGSTSLVAADMLRLMMAEAPWMILATFIVVALLMWINFGSLRWASLAILPLIVGVLWMLLAMEFLGLKLNFYNLVVLPAVLGIGNDAGVHLVHRYREEGRGSIMAVIRSTGEHVTIGSLTTMIGFAGLLLSFHPGLMSIGELAVVGIGSTLLAALLFLPALLQWREDRMGTSSGDGGAVDADASVARDQTPEDRQVAEGIGT